LHIFFFLAVDDEEDAACVVILDLVFDAGRTASNICSFEFLMNLALHRLR